MIFDVVTLFPEMISSGLNTSIIGRAQEAGLISVNIVNIRDYTEDKYGRVDSAPIGGGAGLIMKCQPVLDALKANRSDQSHVLLLSPRGNTYNQQKARSFAANFEDLVIY